MQEIECSFTFSHIPPVLRRKRHVLILLTDGTAFFLGTKPIYPTGIYRMVGGGLNEGEDASAGALRELYEETGIERDTSTLHELLVFRSNITENSSGQTVQFTTTVFWTHCSQDEIHPSDDITKVGTFDKKSLQELIKRYHALDTTLQIFPGKYADLESTQFRWSDYGAYYGKLHELALHTYEAMQHDQDRIY